MDATRGMAPAAAERTRRHLEHAYARDLPVTLTRYADPQLLGHLPIRCADVLPFLYAQQKANRLQQQQVKRDYGEVAEDATFPVEDASPAALAGAGGAGDEGMGADADGGSERRVVNAAGQRSFAGKRNTLPDAVWHALCAAAASPDFAIVPTQPAEISALAAGVGMADPDESEENKEEDAEGHEGRGEAKTQARKQAGCVGVAARSPRQEQLAWLAHHKEAVLRYLFREGDEAEGASDKDDDNSVNGAASPLAPSRAGGEDSGAQLADSTGSTAAPGSRVKVFDEALLYGVRAIPSHTQEFLEVLASWREKLQAQEEEEEAGGGNEVDDAPPPRTSFTARQSHVIASLLAAGHVKMPEDGKPKTSEANATLSPSPSSPSPPPLPVGTATSSAARLDSYAYNPIVKRSAGDVLDTLVPPRLLLFFDMDGQAVCRYFRRRREQLKTIKRLEAELAALRRRSGRGQDSHEHGGSGVDGAAASGAKSVPAGTNGSSSKAKLLERQLQAAFAAYLGQWDNSEHGNGGVDPRVVNPIIGEALLMMEVASPHQATRQELLSLEGALDQYLQTSRARGAGTPLHSPAYQGYLQSLLMKQQHQQQAASGTFLKTIPGGGTTMLSPQPPPSRAKTFDRSLTSNADKRGKMRFSITADAAGVAAITTNHSGLHVGADKRESMASAVLKKTMGRTQTFAASQQQPQPQFNQSYLPHGSTGTMSRLPGANGLANGSQQQQQQQRRLELNRERTLLQFHLLSQELLRQVAIDLPERGVLLARLLNEASLSLQVYDTLARTACTAAQQHRSLDGAEEHHADATQRLQCLTHELADLHTKKAALEERKAALSSWTKERREAHESATKQRRAFEETVAERLRRHAELVRLQQDKERRGSLAG